MHCVEKIQDLHDCQQVIDEEHDLNQLYIL